jgi:MFS family permease
MTTVAGPVVGGWLVQHLSWRAAFFVNVPIAAAVLLVAFWHVPESRNPEPSGRLDVPGAVLVTVGLAALIYPLLESSVVGWAWPSASLRSRRPS